MTFFESWEGEHGVIDEFEGGESKPETVADALDSAIVEGERFAEAEEHCEERHEIERDIRARFRVDAVREAFTAAYDPEADTAVNDWCLDAFEAVADQYADLNEIETRLDVIDARTEGIEEERDALQERQATLDQELERLASEDDLIKARQQIQDGSKTIERLGEEYATNRLAEHITERLQERFIEETISTRVCRDERRQRVGDRPAAELDPILFLAGRAPQRAVDHDLHTWGQCWHLNRLPRLL